MPIWTFCSYACAIGKKLRQLLLEHGSFEKVEVALVKYHKEQEESKLEGGFFSKIDLEREGWTPFLGLN